MSKFCTIDVQLRAILGVRDILLVMAHEQSANERYSPFYHGLEVQAHILGMAAHSLLETLDRKIDFDLAVSHGVCAWPRWQVVEPDDEKEGEADEKPTQNGRDQEVVND